MSTTTRPNGSLYTRIENRIATVEFGHPASNSFPGELLQRLTAEINELSNNPEVAIIVLKARAKVLFVPGLRLMSCLPLPAWKTELCFSRDLPT